jgi:hypothetical protein
MKKNKDIIIKLPFGLDKNKEALLIAKQLIRQLPNPQKMIGQDMIVQEKQSTITILRHSDKKDIPILSCSICECDFAKNIGQKAFTNFGGHVKEKIFCSVLCAEKFVDISPSRISFTRKFRPSWERTSMS